MMSLLDDILAAVAAVLLLACGILLLVNAGLRSDLAIARANTGALTVANASMKDATEKQNAAIADLNRQAKAQAERIKQALAAAQQQAAKDQRRAEILSHLKTKPGDDCAAAKQIWQTYARGRP